jgi:hypothetical protein
LKQLGGLAPCCRADKILYKPTDRPPQDTCDRTTAFAFQQPSADIDHSASATERHQLNYTSSTCVKRSTPNTRHQALDVKHSPSSTRLQALAIKHPSSNTRHQAPAIKHPTSLTENRPSKLWRQQLQTFKHYLDRIKAIEDKKPRPTNIPPAGFLLA